MAIVVQFRATRILVLMLILMTCMIFSLTVWIRSDLVTEQPSPVFSFKKHPANSDFAVRLRLLSSPGTGSEQKWKDSAEVIANEALMNSPVANDESSSSRLIHSYNVEKSDVSPDAMSQLSKDDQVALEHFQKAAKGLGIQVPEDNNFMNLPVANDVASSNGLTYSNKAEKSVVPPQTMSQLSKDDQVALEHFQKAAKGLGIQVSEETSPAYAGNLTDPIGPLITPENLANLLEPSEEDKWEEDVSRAELEEPEDQKNKNHPLKV